MRPDGIHPRIFKELADSFAKPQLMIFRLPWETGTVPADWKLANIVLIVKKDKKEGLGNYRPVILTSVPGKIMEKVVLGSIEKHLENNEVIG